MEKKEALWQWQQRYSHGYPPVSLSYDSMVVTHCSGSDTGSYIDDPESGSRLVLPDHTMVRQIVYSVTFVWQWVVDNFDYPPVQLISNESRREVGDSASIFWEGWPVLYDTAQSYLLAVEHSPSMVSSLDTSVHQIKYAEQTYHRWMAPPSWCWVTPTPRIISADHPNSAQRGGCLFSVHVWQQVWDWLRLPVNRLVLKESI